MKLYLSAYGQGIHEIVESLDPQTLELDATTFRVPVQAVLRLDRHDPYLDLKINLTTQAEAECDRCLTPIGVDVSARSPMLYVLGAPPKGDDVDDSEIEYLRPGTLDLDLSEPLRDLLILSFSGRHLCADSCRGLCARCGANLNEGSCDCATPDQDHLA